LFSADDNDRPSRCDLQRQGLPRLLGLRLRCDVLLAMFDVAVAAAVLFIDELQEPARAKGGQVNTTAALVIAVRLPHQPASLGASGFVTAAQKASAGSKP
jgi:hypothetical protein